MRRAARARAVSLFGLLHGLHQYGQACAETVEVVIRIVYALVHRSTFYETIGAMDPHKRANSIKKKTH